MNFTIKVPATSANLGPGFDSLGIAVNRYLTVEILESSDNWQVMHEYGNEVPNNEDNLIIAVALRLAPNAHPHRLKVHSEIPLARGLGSSSSAILAGIALGNELGGLNLTEYEMLTKATRLEGHPDNVAPALLGGAVAAYYDQKEVYQAKIPAFEELKLVTFIPDYEVKTADARAALPTKLPFKTSVAASAIANVMLASLQNGQISQARRLMEMDQFHEPARIDLVPQLATIRRIAHQLGIMGTYLSGAGPTVVTIATTDEARQLTAALAAKNLAGEVAILSPDFDGLTVQHEE